MRLWPKSWRRDGRPPLLTECAILLALNLVYQVVVSVNAGNAGRAAANARVVIALERAARISIEPWATHTLYASHAVSVFASGWYVVAQWAGATGLLVWCWRYRPDAYRQVRRVVLWMTALGLAAFVAFPVAPPRLAQHGVLDVVAMIATPGNFHRGALATAADQFGAFPSLHVAWALWLCWTVWRFAPSSWCWRTIAVVYTLITVAVVVATGNHYVVDVVGGALLAPVSVWCETRTASLLPRGRAIPLARTTKELA
jgi:diacylglycerol O-acyltransferase / wax synthase